MAYSRAADIYVTPDDAMRTRGSPARRAAAVTPSDTVDLTVYAKALRIGGAGAIKFIPVNDYRGGDETGVTMTVLAGEYIPVSAARVFATGTTATGIHALYD